MHGVTSHGVRFDFNSDASGDCIITDADGRVMRVPCEALKRLVARWVRDARISALEAATTDEILGMPGALTS